MSNELNVNINQAISLLDESYKTVKVCFDLDSSLYQLHQNGSTKYTYKVRKEVPVVVGNIVVTNRSSSGELDLNFAQVVSIQEEPDLEAALEHNGLKWIVSVLNTDIYFECQERDKKARAILLAQKRDKKRAEIKQYINENFGTEGLGALGFTGVEPVAPETVVTKEEE